MSQTDITSSICHSLWCLSLSVASNVARTTDSQLITFSTQSIVLSVVLTLFAASNMCQAEKVTCSSERDNTAAIIGGVVAVVFIVTAALTTVVVVVLILRS